VIDKKSVVVFGVADSDYKSGKSDKFPLLRLAVTMMKK